MDQSPDPSSPTRPPSRRIGRNEPCPCNSGRKYKRCCALKVDTPTIDDDELDPDNPDDQFAVLIHLVIHAIDAGQLDYAERYCRALKERWPDRVSWRDRYAMLYEARGDHARAAEHWRLAAEFVRTHDGFADDDYANCIANAERLDPSPGQVAP